MFAKGQLLVVVVVVVIVLLSYRRDYGVQERNAVPLLVQEQTIRCSVNTQEWSGYMVDGHCVILCDLGERGNGLCK